MKKKESVRGIISGLVPDESFEFRGRNYNLASIRNTASSVSAVSRKRKLFSVAVISYDKSIIKVTRTK